MKKLIAGGLLALLLFGVAGAVLAAESTGPAPWANLTDKQRSELAELQKQVLSVREKAIDKYLEYKWITAEQAQYLKDRLALQKKYAGQFGFGGLGCGMRDGFGGRGGRGFGPGMRGGFGPWFSQAPNPATK
jgi:hypothetical protein